MQKRNLPPGSYRLGSEQLIDWNVDQSRRGVMRRFPNDLFTSRLRVKRLWSSESTRSIFECQSGGAHPESHRFRLIDHALDSAPSGDPTPRGSARPESWHSTEHMKYRPDIDGMRALAVLSVMLYHLRSDWLPGGFVGVDVFFVISGFVVSGSLAATPAESIRCFIASFYARRLARIIPALVVMLIATALMTTLFVPHAWLSVNTEKTGLFAFFGLSNRVMQHNIDSYFEPRAEFNPFTHTWSLGVEEQFYLLFPLLLFFWVRARAAASAQAAWLQALVALMGAVSLAGCIWATTRQPADAFYSIAFRFWELAAGALLFQTTSEAQVPSSGFVRSIGALSPWVGISLVAAAMFFATSGGFPYPWALLAVIGSVLMLGGLRPRDNSVFRRLMSSDIAVYIGKRSYSLYLWHWPVYVLLRWTVGLQGILAQITALAVSFLLASASYRWVELPLRHNAALQRRYVAIQISFFLFLVACGWQVARVAFHHREQLSLSVVNRNPSDWYADHGMPYVASRECDVAREFADVGAIGRLTRIRPIHCSAPPSPQQLTVFGDSHAVAYLPMYEALASETGLEVSLYTAPACPFLDLMSLMSQRKTLGCTEFWEKASDEVLKTANTGDILFLPSLRLRRICTQSECRDSVDVDAESHSEGALSQVKLARDDADRWLRPFADKRLRILFEAPTPIFRSPPFRCADWFDAANPVCRGGFSQPRAYLEHLRSPVLSAMGELSAGIPGVGIWDPLPLLCPTDTCSAFRDGRPLFFDADHVSAFANSVLYPSFKRTITALQVRS
jgi:peptidoglycan/LPS O-acetylase OafA/YrhL